MFDHKLEFVDLPSAKFLKQQGLDYFLEEDNEEYFAKDAVVFSKAEVETYKTASTRLYEQLVAAAKYVAERGLWQSAGIPDNAVELVSYSLEKELDLQLLGRFDFAGGLDGLPLKLIEFNADTCTMLPETVHVQAEQSKAKSRKFESFNQLFPQLLERFQHILQQHPNKVPNLLLTHLGHEEDRINTEVIAAAAREAGFEQVHVMPLERVIFSEDDGIFIELSPDNYIRYDFLFKMVPWEFIAYDEPELMQLLTRIVKQELAVVLNPAFSMLLQSKAILKYLHELFPNDDAVLKASFSAGDFPNYRYAQKPFFGRVGENIQIFTGKPWAAAQTKGDFGHYPQLYQALAEFNADEDGDIYQGSMYYSGVPCAICLRRRDSLIVDEDAEFISHLIE